MAVPPLLDELLRAVGPTGFEEEVAAIVRREAAAFAEVSGDVLGSTTAVVRGTAAGRLLALVAHCDEVGAMVSHVDDDGSLALHPLGDPSVASMAGRRVVIRARGGRVSGVVATRLPDGEPSWSDLVVDIGASTREEALRLVEPGDPVVVEGPPAELAGGLLSSRACDNRTGLYAALQALRALAADPPAWDVALVATVQEEGAYTGARTSAFRLAPDAALVIDVTWATDVPGARPQEHGHHPLGSGPAILRGPAVHPALYDALVAAARDRGIPTTVEVAGRSLTDADVVTAAGGGVATCIVSIPMRNYHSPAETVDLADVEAVSALVEAFARSLDPALDLVR
jgi:endoglucanase